MSDCADALLTLLMGFSTRRQPGQRDRQATLPRAGVGRVASSQSRTGVKCILAYYISQNGRSRPVGRSHVVQVRRSTERKREPVQQGKYRMLSDGSNGYSADIRVPELD